VELRQRSVMSPIAHTARLPHGFRVRFSWTAEKSLQVEWEPDVPRIQSARHRRKFFEAYATARREFMRIVATVIGGNVVIVDVPGGVTDDKFTFEAVSPATRH
jgi:hypothetical protein